MRTRRIRIWARLAGTLWFVPLAVVACPMPATAAVDASDWPTVGPGEMDTDSMMVTMVQYLLRAHGLPVIVKGEFGAQTQQGVRAFQRTCGLRVSGRVDGRTWGRLIVPLQRGSQGDAVRAVQAALEQNGDEKIPIDGTFGARTERDVRMFQRSNYLRADGIVGPVTWLYLTDPVPD